MSRLERLVVLLDTGSTQFIRNTAADQLSDLAKAHPEETLNLLSRVYPFLTSKKWETRVTAARAIGGIVSHADLWDPNSDDVKEEEVKKEEEKVKIEELTDDQIKIEESELNLIGDDNTFISFDNWDLYGILNSGKVLLSHAVEDNANSSKNLSSVDCLKRQKLNINKKLGLKLDFEDELMTDQEVKPEDPIKSEIPINSNIHSNSNSDSGSNSPLPNIDSVAALSGKGISSARLKAMAKRKAKMEAKGSSQKKKPIDLSQSSVSRQLVKQDVENDNSNADKNSNGNGNCNGNANDFNITSQDGGNKLVMETKAPEIPPILAEHAKVAGLVWPFQGVYELLILNLFSETWEIRHGAVLGLRELIKKHGKGAGRVKGKSRKENDDKNRQALEDLCCRLLTLFALDRFGDYIHDTVVAPVRESGAQALSALLIHLDDDLVLKAFKCLEQLILQDNDNDNENNEQKPFDDTKAPRLTCWEASHGGMLGLRYFVSIRTDILNSKPELLDDVVKMVLHGLKESDDDVQAVAASTLTPITEDFVKLRKETINVVLSTIWMCLTRLKDDLSASIGSVMDLLSKLCIHPEVLEIINNESIKNKEYSLKNLVPKLFPFLRHSITNVRKSVLNTLLAFLSVDNDLSKNWIDGTCFRLIFQNLLLEQNEKILTLSEQVFEKLIIEGSKQPDITLDEMLMNHLNPIINLVMTPIGVSRYNYHMNTKFLMKPTDSFTNDDTSTYDSMMIENEKNDEIYDFDKDNINIESKRGRKRKNPSKSQSSAIPIPDNDRVNIDGPMISGDVTLLGVDVFIRTRLASSKALGKVLSYLNDNSLTSLFELLKKYLDTPHSTPRLLTSIVINEYCKSLLNRNEKPSKLAYDSFYDKFLQVLSDPSTLPYYRELVPNLKAVRTQCHALFRVFTEQGRLSQSKIPEIAVIVQGEPDAGPGAFNLEKAQSVIDEIYPKLFNYLSPGAKLSAQKYLNDAKTGLQMSLDSSKEAKFKRTTGILSNYASAAILLGDLPKKLNPFIRSLMDSVKSEESQDLQKRSSISVADLILKLISNGKTNVSDKIIKNLCGFLCIDTTEVPEFTSNKNLTDIILTLKKEDELGLTDLAAYEKSLNEARIKRRGAKFSLEFVLKEFKSEVFIKIPQFKSIIFKPLEELMVKDFDLESIGQEIVDSLGILKALIPTFDSDLHEELISLLPNILVALRSKYSVFRYSAAKTLASLSKVLPSKIIPFIVKSVLPLLNNAGDVSDRQGGIEAVFHLSNIMEFDILPYVIFLIVPVLGRMSDSDHDVRVLATTTFASIIKLVPLEAGIPDPKDVPVELLEGREKEREFIQQMMDPSKSKPFELPVAINATLRKYQQEGVNWLAFLNKYHLHGILCDDMGLGKTLQTICIVASDHHLRSEDFKVTNSIETRPLPTIIICPPSLTGHWEQEFNQYSSFLKVVVYAGGPSVRNSLRDQLKSVDIIVTSYDVVRNDIEFLSKKDYNYCVLDEGHIIKNSSSKLTKSVKMIRANHRLILSGTPIQNNVLELWSLFDFLMPGFLGTEKLFQERFAKPIAASRNSKTSSKEQEAGALALEALHKQVLPFMLRRLKEEVLSDLPPKIIQDYYCTLSDLQKQLYNDFANKQKNIVKEDIQTAEVAEKKTHIFQALQYMRKLCNHPALVLSNDHPQYKDVEAYLKRTHMQLHDIKHAPKLLALRTLLLECGIGVSDVEKNGSNSNSVSGGNNVISQHRALIFCQLKDMLDMVENDLLRKHLPSVTFMRLDGSTEPRQRQSIVRKFNEDPSIDVLLLTTKVGGLGLNLTGADTVIFVEHDWNPMNDLQAMDRAHRLGQKKVVNVYRLITKDTLEEKIMGLQKFKMNIASTIVSQQNAGLASMDTNQLLDLFDVDSSGMNAGAGDVDKKDKEEDDNITESGLTGKAGAIVGELGELWDESQYEEEYNLDTFIKSLK